MYIGIDPGTRGAIAVLNDAGNIKRLIDMPRPKVGGGIDVDKLADIMQGLGREKIQSLYVEKPFFMPSDLNGRAGKYTLSVQSQMQARINSGIIYGMAKMIHRDTQLVEPRIWKKAVGLEKGAGKPGSINMAKSIWPASIDIRETKDGRAEAALIAFYGMRHAKFKVMHMGFTYGSGRNEQTL